MPTELQQNPRFTPLIEIPGQSAIPCITGKEIQSQAHTRPKLWLGIPVPLPGHLASPEVEGSSLSLDPIGGPPGRSMKKGIDAQRLKRGVEG
jgi:hypothetical protein